MVVEQGVLSINRESNRYLYMGYSGAELTRIRNENWPEVTPILSSAR